MAFSEDIKLQVKKWAAFRCCRCQTIGVEIHHIIPQKDGGPDTIDNAAPLCPNCHTDFGDNPIKRKGITEMRDWWYEVVDRMYPSTDIEMGKLIQKIDALVLTAQGSSGHIEDLKSALRSYTEIIINKITPQSSQAAATSIVNMIPLDTGYSIHPDDVAAEGYCQCERNRCVENSGKVYCYWPKWLPDWVIKKGLYHRCYDEIVNCPRCGEEHKRGHVGKADVCGNPYVDQNNQVD